MIGALLWLIYLLTCSDTITKRALLKGSKRRFWCQWFGVNMGFSNEYRILRENLYVLKAIKQKKLQEFLY